MASRIVTRAIQQASQTPSRLLPFVYNQSFSNVGQGAPFLDGHSRQSWLPLGFPPLSDAGRSHGSLFFFNKFSPESALSPYLDAQLQTQKQKLDFFPSILFKTPLQDSASEALWKLSNSNYLPPSSEIDEVILPSLHEDITSPMLMNTKRTFNPSTIVRKRRHGFLARKATVGGRRILARRFLKGRRRLSA